MYQSKKVLAHLRFHEFFDISDKFLSKHISKFLYVLLAWKKDKKKLVKTVNMFYRYVKNLQIANLNNLMFC